MTPTPTDKDAPDRLRQPLPGRTDGKTFREVTLVDQHEVLFRFLEQIADDVQTIKDHLQIPAWDGEGAQ